MLPSFVLKKTTTKKKKKKKKKTEQPATAREFSKTRETRIESASFLKIGSFNHTGKTEMFCFFNHAACHKSA